MVRSSVGEDRVMTAGHFVGEHDHGIANFEFGVPDLSIRSGHARGFLGTECLLVISDRPGAQRGDTRELALRTVKIG